MRLCWCDVVSLQPRDRAVANGLPPMHADDVQRRKDPIQLGIYLLRYIHRIFPQSLRKQFRGPGRDEIEISGCTGPQVRTNAVT
jgi:hypothetical protein